MSISDWYIVGPSTAEQLVAVVADSVPTHSSVAFSCSMNTCRGARTSARVSARARAAQLGRAARTA